MYIVEIIAKLIKRHKGKKKIFQETDLEEDIDNCKHIYFAIDSTKDYLACSKCGNVIKNQTRVNAKNKSLNRNPFR